MSLPPRERRSPLPKVERDEQHEAGKGPPRGRFQFGIAAMLLVMALVSVLASAFAGMLGLGASTLPRGFFIGMAVAAPLAVLMAVSLLRAAATLPGRYRRWRGR